MHSSLSVVLIVVSCAYLCTATYLPKCSPPDAPSYGYFYPRYYSYSIGSKVKFSCKNGFLLYGYTYTVCIFDKETRKAIWKYNPPICTRKCPALDDPRYGDVVLSGRKPGSKATYTCDDGFNLVGSATRKCQSNGKWSGRAPVCKPIVCPDLEDPAYGSVDDGDNRPETKAVYTCNDGFRLEGEPKRLCQDDGTWDGEAPTCERILCPDLEDPVYGSVDDRDNRPGTKAVYTCNDGFRLEGEPKRLCQDDGTWDGEAPTCERILCPDLEDPVYGSVDDGDNRPGTKAVYTCNDGFRLEGEPKRLCQDDGTWDGEAPTCERILCPDLEDPVYGSVDDGDNRPGTKAVYTCNDGFRLDGEPKRLCQDDGTWDGEAPTCERILCPDLEDPVYGSVDDGDNRPGTKAVYTCNDGFRLEGEPKRLCQDDGTWDGEAPTCERILCPDLEDPVYGSVDDRDNRPGTKAVYTCNDGFRLEGEPKRLCQDDGTWDGEAPTCERILCPDLEDPVYGSVDDGDNRPGTKAVYTCNDGFRLDGEPKRLCQDDGTWDGEAPTCERILCPDLEDPVYGSVDDGDNRPGTKAVYTCNDGFRLEGEPKRRCQDDGTWDGEAPTCERILCPDLEDPVYGSVDDRDNRPGTKAVYTCNDGFRLEGEPKRLCQDDGTWDGEAPTCERILCPDLKDPVYGSVDDGDNRPGTKAVYTCNDGFRLEGEPKRLCQDDGTWDGEAPTCERILCPDLKDPVYGSVDDGDNRPGTKAVYTCNDGFRLVGEPKRLCQDDGTWDGEAPTCERILCPDLVDPVYGSVDDRDNRPGTKAVYTCNDGFRLEGEPKRLCQDDGTWDGEAPTCERILCPDLEDPVYGSVDDGDNRPGTKAVYTCNKGFKLVGESERKCQYSGEWTGEAPVCKSTRCGIPPRPKYGYVHYKSTSHGSRAYYSCYKGYSLSGNRYSICKYGTWYGRTPTCHRYSYDD